MLRVLNEAQEELPAHIAECITQVFGPFAGVPDLQGLCAYLDTVDQDVAHPIIVVSCLDHRYVIDREAGTVTPERITIEEEA